MYWLHNTLLFIFHPYFQLDYTFYSVHGHIFFLPSSCFCLCFIIHKFPRKSYVLWLVLWLLYENLVSKVLCHFLLLSIAWTSLLCSTPPCSTICLIVECIVSCHKTSSGLGSVQLQKLLHSSTFLPSYYPITHICSLSFLPVRAMILSGQGRKTLSPAFSIVKTISRINKVSASY